MRRPWAGHPERGGGDRRRPGSLYTLDSIVYKTFTTPVENLESAMLKALVRLDIEVKEREKDPARSGAARPSPGDHSAAGERDDLALRETHSWRTS